MGVEGIIYLTPTITIFEATTALVAFLSFVVAVRNLVDTVHVAALHRRAGTNGPLLIIARSGTRVEALRVVAALALLAMALIGFITTAPLSPALVINHCSMTVIGLSLLTMSLLTWRVRTRLRRMLEASEGMA